jgi:hypothetical protein
MESPFHIYKNTPAGRRDPVCRVYGAVQGSGGHGDAGRDDQVGLNLLSYKWYRYRIPELTVGVANLDRNRKAWLDLRRELLFQSISGSRWSQVTDGGFLSFNYAYQENNRAN